VRDLPKTFSPIQRIIHWTMVALLLANLTLPLTTWGIPIQVAGLGALSLHVVIGTAVLGLAIIRLAIRLIHGVPPEPMGAPLFFRLFARAGQWIFYGLFFAMPLTGLADFYLGMTDLHLWHIIVFRWLFWALIAIHVSLAIAHQWLWKTDMLGKIVRG